MKPSSTAQSLAVVQELTVDEQAKITSDRSVRAPGSSFTISFDSLTRTYRVQNDERAQSFGPAEFVSEINAPQHYPRVQWQRSDASTVDSLTVFKELSLRTNADPAVPIVYTAHGAWKQSRRLHGSSDRVRFDYFVYGVPTPVANVPRTGVVTYRYIGNGHWAEANLFFFGQSSGDVRVDFSAGTVEFILSSAGEDAFKGIIGGLIGFRAKGSIVGNRFEGLGAFDAATYSGSFQGMFYGPNAEEIGVVFSGVGERDAFNGAFAGTRN